jgi:hypothetical protein
MDEKIHKYLNLELKKNWTIGNNSPREKKFKY